MCQVLAIFNERETKIMHRLRPTARGKRDTERRARQLPLCACRGSPHHDVVRGREAALCPAETAATAGSPDRQSRRYRGELCVCRRRTSLEGGNAMRVSIVAPGYKGSQGRNCRREGGSSSLRSRKMEDMCLVRGDALCR